MTDKLSRRNVLASLAKGGAIVAGVASTAIYGESKVSSTKGSDALFDIHQHLVSADESFSDFDSAALIARDFDARSRIMDQHGIDRSVIFTDTTYRRTNGIESTKKVNDLIATYVSKHSDRFPVGIGTIEVRDGDASLKELERIAHQLKLRGVVWHHAHSGVPINHPFMRPILKSMQTLQLIPFVHIHLGPFESLWMLEVLAEEFPAVTFVAVAALADQGDMEESERIAKRTKNILFETGPVLWQHENGVESFVNGIGADRLLFGTDLYATWPSYRRPTTTLEVLKNAKISEEDKSAILRNNAVKLFGL